MQRQLAEQARLERYAQFAPVAGGNRVEARAHSRTIVAGDAPTSFMTSSKSGASSLREGEQEMSGRQLRVTAPAGFAGGAIKQALAAVADLLKRDVEILDEHVHFRLDPALSKIRAAPRGRRMPQCRTRSARTFPRAAGFFPSIVGVRARPVPASRLLMPVRVLPWTGAGHDA